MTDPINFMFQEQVGMVIFNPTNEDFDMQYAGVSFTLKPGQKQNLAANAANHVLNAFGPRGLCYLAYGANEEEVAAKGRKRNEDFKRKTVMDFNVTNEARKNMNLGYISPTGIIKKYAEELGIELTMPFAKKTVGRESTNNAEVLELKKQVSDLTALVTALLKQKDTKK